MANSKRRCKYCKQYVGEYIKVPAGVFCNASHAKAWADEKRTKEAQKQYKERTKELKTKVVSNDRGYWLKKAQAAFNAYIRKRDEKEPCISCQRHHSGQYHAGHYRTVGGNPELRFEELGCHKQCSVCNNHLSGNITDYRINLIRKIGQDAVDWLEGPHEPKHYSIDDIKQIEKTYKQKLKELNNGMATD